MRYVADRLNVDNGRLFTIQRFVKVLSQVNLTGTSEIEVVSNLRPANMSGEGSKDRLVRYSVI